MSSSTRIKALTLDQYLTIEDELLATEQGRTFLRMRDQRTAVIALEQHQASMRSIKEWIEGAADRVTEEAQLTVIRKELMEMAASIRKTKDEIAAIQPADAPEGEPPGISARRIDMATAELGAIVQSTERATTDILNSAERIMEIAGKVREGSLTELADVLDMESTNILMACGFQDITGQRIAKVVATLRYLEERVDSMIRIYGGSREDDSTFSERLRDTRPDAHLLNGPALEGGIDQSEVDAMFGTPSVASPMDQSNIDSMFDAKPAKAASPAATPMDQSNIDEMFAKPSKTAVPAAATDQSNIDSMFDAKPAKAAAPSAAMDQSNIDSMFDVKPRKVSAPPSAPAAAMDQSAIDSLFS